MARMNRYKGRKRITAGKALLAVLVLCGLFFLSYYFMGDFVNFVTHFGEKEENPPITVQPSDQNNGTENPNTPDKPTPTEPDVPQTESVKGIYIPPAIASDPMALSEALSSAKSSGFNTVVVDIKNEEGQILFDLDVSNYSFSEFLKGDVLVNTDTFLSIVREKGMRAVGRIHAFKDNIAPRKDHTMSVKTANNVTWLDYEYKTFMNPYEESARSYLKDLAQKTAAAGFDEVLFDSLNFVSSGKISLIKYSDDSPTKRSDLLRDFVNEVRLSLSEKNVLLSVVLSMSEQPEFAGIRNSGQDAQKLFSAADRIYPFLNIKEFGESGKETAVIGDKTFAAKDTRLYDVTNEILSLVGAKRLDSGTEAQLIPIVMGTAANGANGTRDQQIKERLRACENNKSAGFVVWESAGDYTVLVQ